jgi:hypothetical protein
MGAGTTSTSPLSIKDEVTDIYKALYYINFFHSCFINNIIIDGIIMSR